MITRKIGSGLPGESKKLEQISIFCQNCNFLLMPDFGILLSSFKIAGNRDKAVYHVKIHKILDIKHVSHHLGNYGELLVFLQKRVF